MTTVYSGRVTNWPLLWTMNVLAVALLVSGGLAPGALWPLVVAAVVLVLANLTMTSLRTTVGPRGVDVRYGLLGVPHFRYEPDAIERADAVDVPFKDLGGLGVHWSPWRGTRLAIRPGPALRLHLRTGRDVTISVTDPDTAVRALSG